ncbi:acyltransferase family protein [Olsenella profusa]|uniref:Acyltransferase family protein n=1 Tax=Olsenella profusa TaxID=138595 RepID=A0ABS2F2V7_9ACTN|nr:acyltransferase family protein [Olsenella profusa]MBM6775150.1 acyltransferase family protein [Olsenella profusa]
MSNPVPSTPGPAAREAGQTAQPPRRHAARNPRIEALRLVAIVGIAVFHTFQDPFAAATSGAWAPGAPALLALSCVSLLGAYGNHVFFLISGFFLVPRAAARAHDATYWRDQAHATVRRALPILATVALYALVALAVDAWVLPIESVGLNRTGWLVGGLQFIWVYLAVVVVTPVIGWVWARVSRPRAVVAALVVVVFAVNAYIAFVSPGGEERGLLEWRKLMSAVSYLVAFLAGGALAEKGLPRPLLLLGVCGALALLAEGAAALSGNLALMDALSFKSTSLLSFALAVCSLAVAARPATGGHPRAAALACWLTPSILGFYVAQSMFSQVWHPAAEQLMTAAGQAAGAAGALGAGAAASVALLAVVLLADRVVRVPVLRALRLA